MASAVAPPSLQRTNSNGHLNVYILIKNKLNDDLLIISQDNLPPTLRTGKLILNQKVTIRDDQRRNIEGVIIYMHHDRENCVAMKNELLHKTKSGDKRLDISNASDSYTCASKIIVGNKNSNKMMKKPLPPKEKTKTTESAKNSPLTSSTSLSHNLYIDEDDDEDDTDITCASMEYSLSSMGKTNQHDETNTNLDDTVATSSTVEENDDNNVYLEQIKDLTIKVQQQAQIIKQKNAQIQRLLLTTIEIPKDQGAQNYILYLGDKVRQQTTKYKYQGNLVNDANKLGLSRDELNEILTLKSGVTRIARVLFQKIIPMELLQVDHWNDLDPYVLLKEKILIKFMECFYGPLQVDRKKIHHSLVNCLRNKRNSTKKTDQETCTPNNGEKANNNEEIDQTTACDDFNTN